jgi:hypothetical protein
MGSSPAVLAQVSPTGQKPIMDPNTALAIDPNYSKQATCGADSGKIYITSEGKIILPG